MWYISNLELTGMGAGAAEGLTLLCKAIKVTLLTENQSTWNDCGGQKGKIKEHGCMYVSAVKYNGV
jgi:hypothetical protein